MSVKHIGLLEALEADTPEKSIWMLFKVGREEHIAALQRGMLYMNSSAYFARREADERPGGRRDPDETVLARIRGGKHGEHFYKVELSIGEGANTKKFDVSESATITVEVPSPENTMLFCFSALCGDDTGRIPGERNGEIWIDPRFREFGSHVLIFRNGAELSRRISKAIQVTPNIYNSRYFQGSYGRVRYISEETNDRPLGLFMKKREIGDISDITDMIKLESLLKSPLKIRRRILKKIGDSWVEQQSEN